MHTPTNRCPNRDYKNCVVCGRYSPWIDLANPGRRPTDVELRELNAQIQTEHNRLMAIKFGELELIPKHN